MPIKNVIEVGRCIQKPYEKGHGEEYENELLARYERGEFFSVDSIHQTAQTHYKKRLVSFFAVFP